MPGTTDIAVCMISLADYLLERFLWASVVRSSERVCYLLVTLSGARQRRYLEMYGLIRDDHPPVVEFEQGYQMSPTRKWLVGVQIDGSARKLALAKYTERVDLQIVDRCTQLTDTDSSLLLKELPSLSQEGADHVPGVVEREGWRRIHPSMASESSSQSAQSSRKRKR